MDWALSTYFVPGSEIGSANLEGQKTVAQYLLKKHVVNR